MVTTIQIDHEIKGKLDLLKVHRRETYNELLSRLIDNCSLEDFDKESLVETLEILSNPETMRNIANALEDINDLNNRNKWVSWEKIKKKSDLNV